MRIVLSDKSAQLAIAKSDTFDLGSTMASLHTETGKEAITGDVHFRALTGPAAPETAEAQIRRYIVEHGLRPGDRLPSEAELTAATGSSRVTVRQVLTSLEALGVLESRAGSGWYVRTFDVSIAVRTFAHALAFHPAVLLDLLAVRTSIEGDLIAGVAGRLSTDDLTALEELVDRMRWRAARGEVFSAEDSEFHRRLIAASGNLVALALVDLYFKLMDALYQQGLPYPQSPALSTVAEAHGAILTALRLGQPT
ncbi:MAG TPA: FCD domain-containing protein, partial [Chloroflexota bacterium]